MNGPSLSNPELPAPINFRRFGDWTSWLSLIVQLLVAPFTLLCLAPFAALAAAFLPGGFWLWVIAYFALLPFLFVPGIDVLQIWLVCPRTRPPTVAEQARLQPLWDQVITRIGKGKRRKYRFRVEDSAHINAAAAGGRIVIVTTRALRHLHDRALGAVLAHALSHPVGLHPAVLVIQGWLARPLGWAARLSIILHNLLAWFSGWRIHWALFMFILVVMLVIRAALLVLNTVMMFAGLLLRFLGRKAEHAADSVATKLGYGPALIDALSALERQDEALQQAETDTRQHPATVPVSRAWATHPPTSKRIDKIRAVLSKT